MIQECIKCKVEFLTEADPYAVLPKPSGVELMCLDCIEKPLKELLAEKCSCASLLGKMSEIDKLKSQLEAANKIIEVQNVALEFYGSESLYMMREYETDMNLTSAVLKEEYRRNNDLSKPNTIKSFSYETTAKLKIDQGKTARQALAEVEKIRNGGEG